jgi:UDP-N-acetylglucosamine 1-carboxyvinyltransferase
LGPLLARLGTARVALPGGCAIGARPVDMHLKGLEKMGARFSLEHGDIVGTCADGLHGAHIILDFPTVGGTENLIMAAVLADGETIIENAAREPEIVDLAEFLRACGARISGHGTSVVRIEGVPRLAGCCYQVMPDRIEAGTYLVAAGITQGRLELEHCPLAALDAVTAKLREMGMSIETRGDVVVAEATGPLVCQDVTTQPYPGFPTDMQAQIMALMTVSQGAGTITEGIFENRFMHVPELCRLGAHIILSGQTAVVRGVQGLTGALVMASDLRASACLVLAGLAAQGTTVVRRIYHLDRGYEAMERKLAAVGACIRREKE